ncbi:ankyrin repeat domain-containing protein [Aspergillus melleus]|uniref:ankyrin repeat domain-containing protein n=1 Tax=Aspergillus melleus TaxID=138277 RepID=UPI001E8E694C|nr:uncharacterized protein LDX57_011024 [Aspergillus melleus]KAH8433390.1 hypothetical protein LDX57_011024 [Aspergillus melleus]
MDLEERLRAACADGNADKVREILESGQDIPQKCLDKALGTAAFNDQPEILKELLEYGAQITELAVIGVSNSESAPMFQHLLNHGWDVNSIASQNPALRYHLFLPAQERFERRNKDWKNNAICRLVVTSEECTRLLLENGADPNIPGRLGLTPLSTAIGHATVAVMELLAAYGARLPSGRLGKDLLLSAIQRKEGALGATKFLLEHGADPNLSTSRGPPLYLAIAMHKKEVVSCLLDYGVDVSMVYRGKAFTQLAEEMGQMDIVSLLAAKTDTASLPLG